MRWQTRLLKLAPLIVLGIVGASVLQFAWRHNVTMQSFAEHHRELEALVVEHHALAFVTYLGVYTLLASLSLPGCVLLSAAGGLLFGWFVGALAAVIGATTGATLFFLLARSSLAGPLSREMEMRICKLRAGFQRDALSYILFLRLTPAFPFGVVNLTAAFLNIRLRDFVLGTFLGIMPATLIFSSAGAGIVHVLNAKYQVQEQCLKSLSESGALAATGDACSFALGPADFMTGDALSLLLVLGVVALVPPIVKKLRKNIRSDA
jgi:uncharacterized membrane protein YdjX (TVP38/TMEM64 family)